MPFRIINCTFFPLRMEVQYAVLTRGVQQKSLLMKPQWTKNSDPLDCPLVKVAAVSRFHGLSQYPLLSTSPSYHFLVVYVSDLA